jgi:hypothetical protein
MKGCARAGASAGAFAFAFEGMHGGGDDDDRMNERNCHGRSSTSALGPFTRIVKNVPFTV